MDLIIKSQEESRYATEGESWEDQINFAQENRPIHLKIFEGGCSCCGDYAPFSLSRLDELIKNLTILKECMSPND